MKKTFLIIGTSIIALRVFGFVSDTWLVVSILVFFLFWNFMLKKFETHKILINSTASILFICALSTYIFSDFFLTKVALIRAKHELDLQASLKIGPELVGARTILVSHIEKLQEEITENDEKDLKKINQDTTLSFDQKLEKFNDIATRDSVMVEKIKVLKKKITLEKSAHNNSTYTKNETCIIDTDCDYTWYDIDTIWTRIDLPPNTHREYYHTGTIVFRFADGRQFEADADGACFPLINGIRGERLINDQMGKNPALWINVRAKYEPVKFRMESIPL